MRERRTSADGAEENQGKRDAQTSEDTYLACLQYDERRRRGRRPDGTPEKKSDGGESEFGNGVNIQLGNELG